MIKIFWFLLLLLCLLFPTINEISAAVTLEVRGDALIPANNRFRKVYGTYNGTYGVEASTDIYDNINLWGNFDQLNRKNHVSDCGHSRINLSTFSAGLKGIYHLNNRLKSYLGLGLSIANISIKNSFNEGSTHSHKTSFGGVVKAGLYIFATKNIFLNCFADYYYQPVHYHHTTDCGGLRIGLGLGASFPFNRM